MKDCPKCGAELTLYVPVGLKLPARYLYKITKSVIRKSDCDLVYADWMNASVCCFSCGNFRETGL